MMIWKRRAGRLPAALGCLLCLLCAEERDPGGEPVVRVEGLEVTRSEVDGTAKLLEDRLVQLSPERVFESAADNMRAQAAAQIVAHRLLILEAEKRNVNIDSGRVSRAMDRVRKRFGDRAAYQRALTSMGQSEEQLRREVAEMAMVDSLLQLILSGMPHPTDRQCRGFHEDNPELFKEKPRMRVSRIFIPLPSDSSSGIRDSLHVLASRIVRWCRDGARFDSLAAAYSGGPSASSGGDMGWFDGGGMRSPFREAVEPLKRGEVSDVVPTAEGFHVFMKTDEKPGGNLPYAKVKDDVRLALEMKRRNGKVKEFIDSLMSVSRIEYLDSTYAPRHRREG